jgi:Putative zinc-finger
LGNHISSELLELYALGRLAEAHKAAVEEHLLLCGVCQRRLERIQEFISALQWGLGRIKELIALHETADGPVYLLVRQSETKFVARVLGRELDYGLQCETQEEAERACRAAFAQMFPEHVCGDKCEALR